VRVSLVGLKCTRSDHPKCARCFHPNCTNGRNIATGASLPAGTSNVTGNARARETPSATRRAPWPATKTRRLSGTSRACPERSEGSAVAKQQPLHQPGAAPRSLPRPRTRQMVSMTKTHVLKSRMRCKSHVRFGSGGGSLPRMQ